MFGTISLPLGTSIVEPGATKAFSISMTTKEVFDLSTLNIGSGRPVFLMNSSPPFPFLLYQVVTHRILLAHL